MDFLDTINGQPFVVSDLALILKFDEKGGTRCREVHIACVVHPIRFLQIVQKFAICSILDFSFIIFMPQIANFLTECNSGELSFI
jgi:hypothetical protein